ncbi:DUF6064 family protein [Ectothiorhodospira lacustris]|uniref:DUF6064 family protein n=1 Tax=Ectothiorhodospira lacustris TaxID=2899127 RepID=UPI001EE8EF61|nr:DUF6064 family protein [Ectothiorhodospira lacustris]MCG5501776.1 DUF6064 family protein [Ectothiorhodospira lacustris]MCG5509497.1 DUF6064 family protein [Ectothiorhodospira lacustris]MCG5521708.1 DUF6064 family protein [Ectothiorhodospira lacustris]
MSDWQTYRLEDFIPFTADIYWRLLERINETFWPLHIVAVSIGLAALLLALRGNKRMALVLLAPAWLTSGILFHLTYYAELNWAAPWFGWGFVAQAVLLLTFAFFAGSIRTQGPSKGLSAWIGTTITVVSLFGYPLIAATIGPGLSHAETYGLHPDPTAIATLGVLLIILRGPALWLALTIPTLWCVIGSLTLMAIDATGALIPLAAATIIAGTAIACSIQSAAQNHPSRSIN